MKKIEQILQDSRYDPKKTPQQEQVIFTIQDQNVGSLQNFVTLTGLPKSGKSRFISAIISSGLTGQEIFTMKVRLTQEHYGIIHLDTEQSEHDYYKMINQIRTMSKISNLPDYFHTFTMREHEPKVLIAAVDHLLKNIRHVGIVILDGILDFLYSYNDETESKLLINHLKRWSKVSNCLIIVILHVGKTSGSTIGHFGAMSDRAAQSILEIKRNDIDKLTTYTLIPKTMRSGDPMVMKPVEIFWNIQTREWEEAGWAGSVVKNKEKIVPQELHMDMHKATLRRIFNTRGLTIKYADLVTEVYQSYGYTRKWAKECISFMLEVGLVLKNSDGLFTLIQQTNLKL